MLLLFVTEVNHFRAPQIEHELSVDSSRDPLFPIYLNITLPHLPCGILGIDAVDESGNHQYDLSKGITKHRLNRLGADIGEYRPVEGDKDFNSFLRELELQLFGGGGVLEMVSPELINQVKSEVESEEGCRVYGKMEVTRVNGNFHLSVHHTSFEMMQQVFRGRKINFSHVIHKMHFGKTFKGMINPLDGLVRSVKDEEESGMFKYFLKLVPTLYTHVNGKKQTEHQYSVSEYFHPITQQQGLPAVIFSYEFSPIVVRITEKRRSLLHLLTKLSAVIGGVFAVTGLVDKTIFAILTLLEPKSSSSRR